MINQKIKGYLGILSFCPNSALRANILSSEYKTYAPQGHFFQGAYRQNFDTHLDFEPKS